MAVAAGKQERGKAGIRSDRRIGARVEQRLNRRGMSFRCRPHQRRLAAPALDGVDRRAVREQRADSRRHTCARSGHQRRFARRQRQVRIRARSQQPFDDGHAAVGAGQRQRCDAVAVRLVDAGACPEQQINGADCVVPHGPVKGSRSVGFCLMDVGALFDQDANASGVCCLGGSRSGDSGSAACRGGGT